MAETKKKRAAGQGKRAKPKGGWGGSRPGAGAKPRPENVGLLPHLARPPFDADVPVHITLPLAEGVPDLRGERAALVIRAEVERASSRGFRVIHYAVRADALHLIAEADDADALSRGVQRFASRVAHLVNALASRRGRIWRERYRREDLTTAKQYRDALVEVLFAPSNGSGRDRSRGQHVFDDAHSSILWVDAWDAPADFVDRIVAARVEPAPIAKAQTSIASRGWQRLGRLRPDEKI